MKIEIKNRWTGSVIFSLKTKNIKLAVEAAIKSGANLRGADLSGADLRGVDLRGVDLSGVDLRGVNLRGVNLRGVDLRGVNLRGVDLRGAKNAELAKAQTIIVPDGELIGWKKAINPDGGYCIVKLLIPTDARRSNSTGRKCRAEYAKVLEVIGCKIGVSGRDRDFKYSKGKTVKPDSFDLDRFNECSNGIHFFITREEAEEYLL